jgi:glutamate N-acetyltransferase / amino-acid N-acetyltransferase
MQNHEIRTVKGGILAAKGFKAAGVKCGLKKKKVEDFAMIFSEVPAVATGVFSRNQVLAAPVQLSKKLVRRHRSQAIVVNAGCANAFTGARGMNDAIEMAKMTGSALDIPPEDVLIASTGVIGEHLDMEKIQKGIDSAAQKLSRRGAAAAARAILTTDLVTKTTARQFELGIPPVEVTIGAMAKGSGMIHPDMGTMLGFIATDVAIDSRCLRRALKIAVEESFNMLTVDGDTSTNDTVFVLANGLADNPIIADYRSEDYALFLEALTEVCKDLTEQIAADGEGATKMIKIHVSGARNQETAKSVARAIAGSNLIKTAVFGNDPNWGRIVCAIGYSAASIDPDSISLRLCGHIILKKGQIVPDYKPDEVSKAMDTKKATIEVHLGQGRAEAIAWTCDLTEDYIKINADYHT